MAANKNQDDTHTWKLDKRIPLTLIVLLVGQTLGFVWSAAELASEVKHLRETTDSMKMEISSINTKVDNLQTVYVTKQELMLYQERTKDAVQTLVDRIDEVEEVVYKKAKK